MNLLLISFSIALLLAVGLVVSLALVSFLSGGMDFLFGGPKLYFLKATRTAGFSFGFRFNQEKEPARFDRIQIRLFNPFAKVPEQREITKAFAAEDASFAMELDFGESLKKILETPNLEMATVTTTISATADGVSFSFNHNGDEFKSKVKNGSESVEDFNRKFRPIKSKRIFHQVEKNFISEPLEQTGKKLKLSTNPEFASEFKGEGASSASLVPNFLISKAWIEPGCIVCDACETIYPEVFQVLDATCIVRPNYPMNNGLLVEEAAEACPVEVIKFTKA